MPRYKYKAIAEDGTVIKGDALSDTREELAKDLASQGLFVIKISRFPFFTFSRKSRLDGLLLFLKEFTALIRSGLSLQDALQVTARGRGTHLGGMVSQIRISVLHGKPLSTAFSKLAEAYDPLLLSVVTTGERTGKLAHTLKSYEALLTRKIEIQRKVRHAMLYPLFVILVMSVIFVVIFQFSLPRFVGIYADLNAELPASTSFLLYISNNFLYITIAIGMLVLIVWQAWRYVRNKSWLVEKISHYSFRIAVIGEIQRSYLISLFARTLSSLLSTGIPLVEAVQHTSKSLPNRYVSERLASVNQIIAKGESLTTAIRGTGLFPAAAQKIIEAGEKSGSLEEQLTELAQFYENDIEYRIGLAVSLVEPLLILVTGIIVGGVVLVMYLPIFNLAGAIS